MKIDQWMGEREWCWFKMEQSEEDMRLTGLYQEREERGARERVCVSKMDKKQRQKSKEEKKRREERGSVEFWELSGEANEKRRDDHEGYHKPHHLLSLIYCCSHCLVPFTLILNPNCPSLTPLSFVSLSFSSPPLSLYGSFITFLFYPLLSLSLHSHLCPFNNIALFYTL